MPRSPIFRLLLAAVSAGTAALAVLAAGPGGSPQRAAHAAAPPGLLVRGVRDAALALAPGGAPYVAFVRDQTLALADLRAGLRLRRVRAEAGLAGPGRRGVP